MSFLLHTFLILKSANLLEREIVGGLPKLIPYWIIPLIWKINKQEFVSIQNL